MAIQMKVNALGSEFNAYIKIKTAVYSNSSKTVSGSVLFLTEKDGDEIPVNIDNSFKSIPVNGDSCTVRQVYKAIMSDGRFSSGVKV